MDPIVQPRLYPWGPRTLYLGAAQRLSPHRNAVACFALSLEGSFEVSHDPVAASAPYRTCRSALIFPNTLHHFRNANGAMAFLYLDAQSDDVDRIANLMQTRLDRVLFDILNEELLACTFLALWRKDADWAQTRTILDRELLGSSRQVDSRIRAAIDRMAAEPLRRIPARQLARSVELSESRFLHLFSRETGVPFRRYQLWLAMGAAMRALASGASLTTAALSAGFSS